MHPKDALNEAIKEAMKNKDSQRRDTLRLVSSALKQVEIDTRQDLTAEAALDVLQKEAKKYRESITELEKAGRADEVAQQRYELGVLEEFLPKQMTPAELEALIKAAIASTGATTGKDMGKVMGMVSPQTKGRADGKLVSEMVKTLLNS